MNLHTLDAPKRRKLSLSFGDRKPSGHRIAKTDAHALTRDELQRIVADMVD
jgi:hypothetical protein